MMTSGAPKSFEVKRLGVIGLIRVIKIDDTDNTLKKKIRRLDIQ
jgi:hypothetical protein